MRKPTFRELSKFDLKSYAKLLRYFGQTYQIVPFCEIPREHVRHLILRHDVDISPSIALKMAEFEHNMRIRSTYFFLLSGNLYNALEGRNVSALRQISRLGHEIGLHYDPNQYEHYGQNPVDILKTEIQLLESLANCKVYSISRHGPRNPISFIELKGYLNADDPTLRDFFVHDSAGFWSVKTLSVLLKDPPERAQLLIHPCHWQGIRSRTKLSEILQDLRWLLYKLRASVYMPI